MARSSRRTPIRTRCGVIDSAIRVWLASCELRVVSSLLRVCPVSQVYFVFVFVFVVQSHVLLPTGAFQAYGITRWLENGAFDALEKGYLKNISLRIHGGAGATGPTEENILERYDCESSACTRAVQAGVNSSHYSVEVNGALDGNVTVKQNGTTVSAFLMTRMRQETVRACVRARTSPIAPTYYPPRLAGHSRAHVDNDVQYDGPTSGGPLAHDAPRAQRRGGTRAASQQMTQRGHTSE
jgi:hypothetical protein